MGPGALGTRLALCLVHLLWMGLWIYSQEDKEGEAQCPRARIKAET
jgi:hypothetical protein